MFVSQWRAGTGVGERDGRGGGRKGRGSDYSKLQEPDGRIMIFSPSVSVSQRDLKMYVQSSSSLRTLGEVMVCSK